MAVKRKRKRTKHNVAAKKDVDWASYFAKIRGVCPWSYKAHMNDNILFIPYSEVTLNTWAEVFGSSSHEAYVYKCHNKSADWLNDMCDQLNQRYQTCEWLWSHPEKGGDSTPIPVLIQQDKELLTQLREKVGYEED